jgi:folate-binding protein YgfZ
MPTQPPATIGIDAQYRILLEEAGLLERSERVLIAVSGPEGAEFLQGQLTNDIEALEPGAGCYAALLDRKGRMRADMRVLRLASDLIWLDLAEAQATEVERHLQMYKVGREVEVGIADGSRLLSLIGPGSGEILGGRPAGREHDHAEIRIAETDARVVSTTLGADLIVPGGSEAAERVEAELIARGAEPVSAEAAEILRVEAGRPAFGAEMGNETIPQEAGINERAVSFTKGCYIGQETVARLHYKGKPNRALRRLTSSEPLEPGAPVTLGERELGRVGTAVLSPARGPLALAILRREASPGDEVLVGGSVAATVEEIGA